MLAVLEAFGFASLEPPLTKTDFLNPNRVIQLGSEPNRIDLVSELQGVEFEEAWKTRTVLSLDGLTMNFIDRDSLIQNKKHVGRKQDLLDIEALEKMRPKKQ